MPLVGPVPSQLLAGGVGPDVTHRPRSRSQHALAGDLGRAHRLKVHVYQCAGHRERVRVEPVNVAICGFRKEIYIDR